MKWQNNAWILAIAACKHVLQYHYPNSWKQFMSVMLELHRKIANACMHVPFTYKSFNKHAIVFSLISQHSIRRYSEDTLLLFIILNFSILYCCCCCCFFWHRLHLVNDRSLHAMISLNKYGRDEVRIFVGMGDAFFLEFYGVGESCGSEQSVNLPILMEMSLGHSNHFH